MTHISERESELPEAVIGKLLKIASEEKEIISLGPGEPDFLTPKPILDYGKKIIEKGTHYSAVSGTTKLKEAIAKKLKKENKIDCSIENITVTNGSQEALFMALLCTIDPSEQVILQDPGFLGYLPAIELVEGVPISLKLEEVDDFEIDPDTIKKLIDKKKTRVILINTPSNPTGNVLSKKTLEEIADIAIDTDTFIFSDEAYEKLVYDKKHISIGSLNGMEDHVVTFQTFSKTYAMCGFRLGYACGPEDLIKAMSKVHTYITLCPGTFSQLLGLKALSLKKSYINKMVFEYNKRRKFIVKRLNQIGLRTPNPQGAFYAFSNIQEFSNNSFNFANRLLKKAKVAVVPGSEFGKYGEGFIRFSYATSLDKIKIAMDRLERFLKK